MCDTRTNYLVNMQVYLYSGVHYAWTPAVINAISWTNRKQIHHHYYHHHHRFIKNTCQTHVLGTKTKFILCLWLQGLKCHGRTCV